MDELNPLELLRKLSLMADENAAGVHVFSPLQESLAAIREARYSNAMTSTIARTFLALDKDSQQSDRTAMILRPVLWHLTLGCATLRLYGGTWERKVIKKVAVCGIHLYSCFPSGLPLITMFPP